MEEQKYSIVQQILQAAQQTQQTSQDSYTEAAGVQAGSELKPRPRFNPAEDVTALEKAITAKVVDNGTIIDILTKRTNVQRQEIKAGYQKQTGKSLEEALKKALSGKFEDVILSLLKTPSQFDASELKAATKGLGTNEDTIIEILTTRSNQQIKQIKTDYKAEYKTDLENDIIDDTSGDFKKVLVALMKGERSEDCYVNQDLADKDAKALYDAGENSKKTDASPFINIFTQRSFPHLHQVCKNYTKYSKHDLNKALDLKLKGDIESCLVAIVKVAVNKPGFFAEKLHLAMKGLGTRDKVVTRIIVSQQETDLKAIKPEFKKLTGKSLREDLMDELKGDYETVLMGLVGYDD
ncbi:annexin A1-like [Anomaloglossus baeobatrachus]|uniref:annexin A1-like n=1 Tax=Anomaloglossus baeobatrachus TaxID=238106 RepID=UPI003F4FF9DD